MIEFAPLIAGIENLIIPALIFFFIFLVNAVSQMAKKGQQGQQQRGPNPQQPRANVPRPPPARQPAAGRPAGGVADEINSFLNRLTQPQGQQQPPAQQPPAQQRPAPQRPVRQPPPATAKLVDSSRPVEAEVITLAEPQSVGGHVKSHLGSRELGQRLPTHLEGKAAQADDKMEAHLHGVFDHGIGSLAHEDQDSLELGDPAGEIPATAAAGLAAMFANPGNIRQAIIIQEVLNRPIDRWS